MRSTLILLLFKLLFFFLNVGLNVGLNAPNAPNAPTKLGPQLGQSSHVLSNPAALGTWSWGNKLLYSYSSKTDDAPILQAYKCSRQMGVNVFDTGDSYGTGELEGNAERLLRTCEDSYRNEHGEEDSNKAIFIAKIAPYPWLLTSESYYSKIQASHSKLIHDSTDSIFIPSIHWSPQKYLPFQVQTLYTSLLKSYETGLCTEIGFSNLGANELLKAGEYFQKNNVPIACNQIQCSLVVDFERDVEKAVEVARDIGVTTFGYSPLGLGLLVGERRTRSGVRKRLFESIENDKGYKHLRETLKGIAEERGVEVENVAIAWVRKKGLVPLVGCRNAKTAEVNFRDFEITEEEFGSLEEARARNERKGTRNIFMTD